MLAGRWWNGRHSGLKIRFHASGVRVRVPLALPEKPVDFMVCSQQGVYSTLPVVVPAGLFDSHSDSHRDRTGYWGVGHADKGWVVVEP
jgi:hypothetical protein